jgi:NADPH-dependent glutamate synthase beta subunit-like oxidoreductase/glutamate synthase domain-containing protein 3/Pyruvate/2-oxoacid:ferredoxin oxidoreductase delta subunit
MANDTNVQIDGIIEDKRISTQKLLQEIYKQLDAGKKEFVVNASGQHVIGGALWDKDGGKLKFTVRNPGQRVGAMGMQGTEIIIEGSAPADVGWLNAGAEIILKGDGGDTTAHCAASGKIYVAGRVGTRSGALMKADPKYPAPEFWVLKNTGSFSFEFMGGGIGVVCGYERENLPSVLGSRSCVGMVGGTVYFRGNVQDLSDDVWIMDLDERDKDFLLRGLPEFLKKIGKEEALETLIDMSQWKKVVAKAYDERNYKYLIPIQSFRENKWVEGGIFGDLIDDDFNVADYVEKGDLRLKIPEWLNAHYSAPCEYGCPIFIPTQKRIALLREGKTKEAIDLIKEYSPFPASVCGQVCPNLCMDVCTRAFVDIPVKIGELGLLSKDVKLEWDIEEKPQKVAIIGAGAAGLAAAYHLRKFGYQVEIFEADSVIGGKLKQVIPAERLNQEILQNEIDRILELGMKVNLNTYVDSEMFEKLTNEYDAVIAAIGAHIPFVIPVEGHEKIVKGLDFLKEINKGNKPKVGEKVVVIGAGNAGMDVVMGAYEMGAKEVTAIDIQKPAAFEKEIEHAKKLGCKIIWPAFTEKVTDEGVVLKDGTLLEADTVIISIGDRPDFSFLPSEYIDEKGKVKINDFMHIKGNKKVFVPGDAVKLGLFTHALGDGRKVAINIDKMFKGEKLDDFKDYPMIPQDRVKDEYYHPMNNAKVLSMDIADETKRCMSCGYCRDCEFCMEVCPEQAIERLQNEDGTFEYISRNDKCIGCGICAGVCPCGVWTMKDNLHRYLEA